MKVIHQAAIQHNGIIYKGDRHKNIKMKMPKHLGYAGAKEGFVTNTGIFVDRETAADLAYQCGQISEPVEKLKSEHLW